jgi:hypothetical protein
MTRPPTARLEEAERRDRKIAVLRITSGHKAVGGVGDGRVHATTPLVHRRPSPLSDVLEWLDVVWSGDNPRSVVQMLVARPGLVVLVLAVAVHALHHEDHHQRARQQHEYRCDSGEGHSGPQRSDVRA